MHAIGLTRHGGPDALRSLDLHETHTVAGEARIRVHAAAVNPVDSITRSVDRGKLRSRRILEFA